jgi:Response regulators consisting of a CheY-like receiver domain and a winged-helix DNA-binding domain
MEDKKIRMLLVEDERTLAQIIRDTLTEKGFDVQLAYNGQQGYDAVHVALPDIIVTDIMMPSMDGFTFVKKLRSEGYRIPIIFLSARSAAEDVVEGFETGGNDYLRKPFAMSELIVRAKSLLGRSEPSSHEKPQTVFQIGSYIFDSEKQTLTFTRQQCGTLSSEDCIVLSAREADVLVMLCRRPGEVIPSEDILKKLWGSDDYFNSRSLNVFITHLRNKLAKDPSVSIVNARGIGYKLLRG